MLRVFRGPQANFKHDAELADQVYTDDALRQLADAGFNAVHVSLRSAANYYRLHLLKRAWRPELMPQFLEIARDELANVDVAIPVYESEPRQGYHSEAHGYMVTPELLRRKRELLRQMCS